MTYKANLSFHHEHRAFRAQMHLIVSEVECPMLLTVNRLLIFFIIMNSRYSLPILIGKEGYGEGCAVDCRPHSFEQVYYDNLLYLCFATNMKYGLDNYHLILSIRQHISTINSNCSHTYAIYYGFSYWYHYLIVLYPSTNIRLSRSKRLNFSLIHNPIAYFNTINSIAYNTS